MGRRLRSAGLSEQMVLAKLGGADHELAARALRRYRAWRDAAAEGASPQAQRSLRRAWERGRDEALAALPASDVPIEDASQPKRGIGDEAASRASTAPTSRDDV